MRKNLFLLLILFFSGAPLHSQTVLDKTLQMRTTALDNPPRIQLDWLGYTGATGYTIYRKAANSNNWGIAVASLPDTTLTWTDTNISPGQAWDYRIFRSGTDATNGYAYSGLLMPPVEQRGKILLVIDTTYIDSLALHLARLESDLRGDGWLPIRHHVSPSDPVTSVKSLIRADYLADTARVKAVFLIGHVPVPYSGDIYPDGHTDHRGAWPCDAYYADMDGNWTDISINSTTGTRPQNHNIPGDGKFDQSIIPSPVELWVGRIDFANLSTFPQPEYALLRRYLDKDHAWRQGQIAVNQTAIVDDNFGVFPSEVFAGNAWRNFAPLLGFGAATSGDFRTAMSGGASQLWAYGCGGGSYTSASGVATTGNFASDSLSGVFSMIFGSYHGDWDSNNNLLRAAVATKGSILTCTWTARPDWHYYHMGQGLPIGYSTRLVMNNASLYSTGYGGRQIHIGLMGDPSLRMTIVKPASALTATPSGRDVALAWTASPDATAGYYIYRAPTPQDPFTRLTPSPVTATTWSDSCVNGGTWTYMVRALRLEDGPSGSYWNLSQGSFADATISDLVTLAPPTLSDSLACAGGSLSLNFSGTGHWCHSNTFRAELSDAFGSFAAPATIGQLSGATLSALSCTLPALLAPGTDYRIRITSDQAIASSPASITSLEILAEPTALFAYALSGPTATFTQAATGATTYHWAFGDGDTSALPNPVHTYTASGTYTVTLTVSNLCGSATYADTLLLNLVGTPSAQSSDWHVFPNPVQHELRWVAPDLTELSIYNAAGQRIHHQPAPTPQGQLSTSDWPGGIYLVVLKDSHTLQTFNVLKE